MDWPLIDTDRSARLRDVGAPDFAAVVTVDAAGDEKFWLLSIAAFGRSDADCGNPDQPHEQIGRLPGEWRERVWGDLARCGRLTGAGQPCRHSVGTPGEPCTQHRGLPKAAERPPRRRMPRAVCPHCGKNVAVAPKRGTFTRHDIYHENQWGGGWEQCPMSGQPAEVESS